MKIVKFLDSATAEAVCHDTGEHSGPLYRAGQMTLCEGHLFQFGRLIADTLAAERGKPPQGFIDEIKKDTQRKPETKPFTWG